MGSEESGTEIQNPTHTQTQQHSNPTNVSSPENHANGYQHVTANNNDTEITSHHGGEHAQSDRQVTLVVHPHSLLPMPVPPQSFKVSHNDVVSLNDSNFSVGSFLRQRSSDLSAAIVKRVSSLRPDI